jgi:nitronate monooxygenase
LSGPNIWPEEYDGRSLAVRSYTNFADGMSLEDVRKSHREALKAGHKGYETDLRGSAAIWVGTGVGLVQTVESARDIVEKARTETREILSRVAKL